MNKFVEWFSKKVLRIEFCAKHKSFWNPLASVDCPKCIAESKAVSAGGSKA